jgi:hypothetical protein
MKKEILNALEEVRNKVSKDIDTVIFLTDNTWIYMISETREIPNFEGKEIDVSLLDDAIDSVDELPFIYQLNK